MTAPVPIPERQFSLEVEGGQITGWLSGTGPPLLLLHGGPGFSEYLGGLAAELAPAFTVFRYQQRGQPPSVTEGDPTANGPDIAGASPGPFGENSDPEHTRLI